MTTPEPKLLTPDELEEIRKHWELTSDKGSWGKEDVAKLLGHVAALTYASDQNCGGCNEHKHTPLRNDTMGGYVCLTCIDRELIALQQDKERLEHLLMVINKFGGDGVQYDMPCCQIPWTKTGGDQRDVVFDRQAIDAARKSP